MNLKEVRLKRSLIKICETLMCMYQKTPFVPVHSITQEREEGGVGEE